ncbi:MAG: hypothetical protein J0626_05765, partial [Rhodospirillaceae bacterium]|nr:hypothetical protein [Rhodospirillaceae bacterium]
MLPAKATPAKTEPATKAPATPKAQVKPVAQVAPAKPAEPEHYVIKSALQIDGPLKHGDYVWNDEGVPQGPMLITVDLTAQTLSVFR